MKKFLFILLSIPCIANSQTGSEIYLFDVTFKNGQPVVSSPINMTKREGYNNQPFFHPQKSIVYYSSVNSNGKTDIRYYDYVDKSASSITYSEEGEYSPTVTPDGEFISCIIQRSNGTQDLGKYPLNGGELFILINTLKVGYHVWVDKNSLLLFVLEDTAGNTLHYYNLKSKEDKVLLRNPGRSLHKIPGSDAVSFVDKSNKNEWLIKRFDNKTKEISLIATTLPGREDLCWLNNGLIIMSDGANLFYLDTNNNQGWKAVSTDTGGLTLKAITRLAANANNTKLAVVVSQ